MTEMLIALNKWKAVPVIARLDRDGVPQKSTLIDEDGDAVCGFCNMVFSSAPSVIKIGSKCWNCNASVIEFQGEIKPNTSEND